MATADSGGIVQALALHASSFDGVSWCLDRVAACVMTVQWVVDGSWRRRVQAASTSFLSGGTGEVSHAGHSATQVDSSVLLLSGCWPRKTVTKIARFMLLVGCRSVAVAELVGAVVVVIAAA